MKKNISNWCHGSVQIRFSGGEPERFLTLCGYHKIPLRNIKKRNTEFEAELSVKDFFRLQPLRRKTRVTIQIIKKQGMPFFFQKKPKRKAFFLGIFLLLCLWLISSRYLWSIRILGNSYVSKETMVSFLEQEGICRGIKKKKINCERLQTRIRQHFPYLIWVSVNMDGTCLTVEVREQIKQSLIETDNLKKQEEMYKGWDLVADREGVIEKIVTRVGKPVVKEGDSCKKGDLLVSGFVEILNNDGEVQRYEPVNVDADVWIRTVYHYYDSFPLEKQEKKYIERTKNYLYARVFGREFSMWNLIKDKEKGRYEILYIEKPSMRISMPVSFGKIQIRPYEIEKMRISERQQKQIAQCHASRYLQQLSRQGIRILSFEKKEKQEKGQYITHGKVTVIKKQGKNRKKGFHSGEKMVE